MSIKTDKPIIYQIQNVHVHSSWVKKFLHIQTIYILCISFKGIVYIYLYPHLEFVIVYDYTVECIWLMRLKMINWVLLPKHAHIHDRPKWHIFVALSKCDPSHNKWYNSRVFRYKKLFLVIICLFFILRMEVFDKQFCFLFTYIVTFWQTKMTHICRIIQMRPITQQMIQTYHL
jgi:hypothetical protein